SLRIDRGPARQSGARWGRPFAVVVATGALVAGGALAYPRLEARIFKTEVAVSEGGLVSPSPASITTTSSGYIVAHAAWKVGSKAVGRVAKVLVKEGDQVKQGDVIALLEESDQRTAMAVARSRATAARARAETARANVAEIEQQATRERALVEKGAVG